MVAVFVAIIAALAGGTAAFAVMEKTVRVDVDGHQVSVRTLANDVAGVLRKEHIALGPHDTVAPDVRAPVTNGAYVVVRHGRPVTLTVDGEQRQVWVTALSVEAAIDQLGLRTEGEWTSVSRSASIPRSGLKLELRIPQHVTVLVDGRRLSPVTTEPTVRDLLASLHVRVGKLDHVSAPLNRYPTDGLVVAIERIHQDIVTSNVAIPFRTIQVRNSSMYVGDTHVQRYGQPGLRVNTYRVLFKNKKVIHRTLLHSKLRSRPVPAIVEVGTKPRPKYAPAADGLNWPALAHCESGGNPRAVSSGGTYRGLYQFTMGTWHSVGGVGDPIDASADEQTYRAQILYRRDGDSPWPVCGHYLYT